MYVSPTQTTTPATGTTGSTGSSAAISSDFSTFLKMLTTQMQNQDPLNPIESSDYALQLATFSGVEQQVRTNELLATLAEQMGGGGVAQYASWVGMEARVTEPVAFAGQPVTLDPSPRSGADQAVLVAYDSQNREVARLDLPLGSGQVVWDGTDGAGNLLASGVYAFRVESLTLGQLVGTDPVAAYGRVAEVRTGTEGATLVLEGGSEVAPADVTALRASAPAG